MSDFKAYNAVAGGSVKKLLFSPSGRALWTVVGKDNEHWTDPELDFCTCKDFYFKGLSGGLECYHLKSVKAAGKNSHSTIDFDDTEYIQILHAIVDDQWAILRRS